MANLRLDENLEENLDTIAHSAEDEEEEARLRRKLAEALDLETGEIINKAKLQNMGRKICSCGFFTCGAIRLFGHPVPVFAEQIEPLYPQGKRDRRAIELKGLSG